MGPTWGLSGTDRPRWALCWPHGPCYLSLYAFCNRWSVPKFGALFRSLFDTDELRSTSPHLVFCEPRWLVKPIVGFTITLGQMAMQLAWTVRRKICHSHKHLSSVHIHVDNAICKQNQIRVRKLLLIYHIQSWMASYFSMPFSQCWYS